MYAVVLPPTAAVVANMRCRGSTAAHMGTAGPAIGGRRALHSVAGWDLGSALISRGFWGSVRRLQLSGGRKGAKLPPLIRLRIRLTLARGACLAGYRGHDLQDRQARPRQG